MGEKRNKTEGRGSEKGDQQADTAALSHETESSTFLGFPAGWDIL